MTEVAHATSADGTRIAYRRVGSGPPVVAVHGGLGTWRSWLAVAQRLAAGYEFLLLDRRGRGDSGDAPAHSLAREVDDVRAVLAAAGPQPVLLGNSFGDAVALELARSDAPGGIRGLALYEPGIRMAHALPPGLLDRIDALLARQRPDEALALAFEQLDAAGIVRDGRTPIAARPPAERDALAALAPTVGRELRALAGLDPDLARYATIDLPTLVLAGAASPATQRRNTAALAATLPNAQLGRLQGQGHVAHTADPDQAARTLEAFLTRLH